MTTQLDTRSPAAALDDERCWQAVLEQDAAFDGAFVLAVRTTGIYCRPTCPARTPKRENVRFLASPDEAEQAGFRAGATNPVSIVIPCHRAVGAGGSLTGYRWGIERKRALQARERVSAT